MQVSGKQTTDEVKKLRAKADGLSDKLQHSSQQMKDLQDRLALLESSNTSTVDKLTTLQKHFAVAPPDGSSGQQSGKADDPGNDNSVKESTSRDTTHQVDAKNNPAKLKVLRSHKVKFL